MRKSIEILSKNIILSFFALFLTTMVILPVTSGENINVTPVTPPFITIDLIGNHAVGDVFTIYGTTNLPATRDSLILQIGTAGFNPAGFGSSFYQMNISVQPGKNGVNTWSAEIIPSLWQIYTEPPNFYPTPTFEVAAPGEYVVWVSPRNPLGPDVTTTQYFSMLSPENRSISNQTSTASPGITINQSPAPTQSSPLSVLLSIAVLSGVGIVDKYLRKKREL